MVVYFAIISYKVKYGSQDFGLAVPIGKKASRKKAFGDDRLSSNLDGRNSTLDLDLEQETRKGKLELKSVVKKFGEFKAVDNISCDIHTNRITCILGHNGAGKTTLINCICGVSPATTGNVILNGVDVYKNPEVMIGNVGYCTADDVLLKTIPVEEWLNFVAALKGVKDIKGHVGKVMRKCNLTEYAQAQGQNLSGGTKRRVNIAAALIGSPQILVMDEPSSGIDPDNRRQLWRLIEHLNSKNRIVILTTHYLEEAEYLSEDVIIMDKGKIDIRGSPSDITKKYGIGYRVTLENIKDTYTKTNLIEGIRSVGKLEGQNLNIDESSLETFGRLSFVLPLQYKSRIGNILRYLEDEGIPYGIDNNTLEEAFINIGEKKSHSEDQEQIRKRELLYSKLMSTQYSPSQAKILKALIVRRFKLFFASPIDISTFLYFMFLPAVLTYLRQSKSKLDLGGLVFFCGYSAFESVVATQVYVRLPYEERKGRMRYYLKMSGVTSALYYSTLFVVDCVFAALMTLLSYIFFFLIYLGKIEDSALDFGLLAKVLFYISLLGFCTLSQCKFKKISLRRNLRLRFEDKAT